MPKPIDTNEMRKSAHGTNAYLAIHMLCDEIDRLRWEQQTPPQAEDVTDEYLTESLTKLADYISNTPVSTIREALIKAGHTPVQTPPQGKTVDVRVAVGVDHGGYWRAEGWDNAGNDHAKELVSKRMDGPFSLFWLTATLPVPAEVCVVARVEGE